MAETAVPGDWTEQFAGTPLDLTNYHLTFADEFDAFSVTPNSGTGPWYAGPLPLRIGPVHRA